MKAKKAKEEKAKKAAAAKKKKAAAKKKSAKKATPSSKKTAEKTESPFPEDEGAMKSYSQAIAQQAENNEPDTPIAYEGESPAEKTVKNDGDEEADKEINDLLLGVSKKKGGLFPGAELV
jgi:protoporphyrinogen oxidase